MKNELYYSGVMAKYKLAPGTKSLSRLRKKLYYHNFLEMNMNKIKNTWKEINPLIYEETRGDNVITAVKRPAKGYHMRLMKFAIS